MIRQLALRATRRLMASRPPDFEVGPPEDIYMQRWYVIPRNRVLNIYAHRFLRDDDPRALHDHPWASVSWILEHGYWELLVTGLRERLVGSVTFRQAITPHRVILRTGNKQAITLFFTGPVQRNWGFHCPSGWRPWEEFVSKRPGGNAIGKGCEE